MNIIDIAIAKGYTEESLIGAGAIKGDKGDPGEPGKDGVNGKDGTNGVDGKDGKDGATGKSAYEIALEHGFEGTEEEWLESLKGETDNNLSEIYTLDANNLFNSATLTSNTFMNNNGVIGTSNSYSLFELDVEIGVTYNLSHSARYVVIKENDKIVEGLQSVYSFTASGTKAFITVFNSNAEWIMCKDGINISDVANYNKTVITGELNERLESVEYYDSYVKGLFTENQNILFGRELLQGYLYSGGFVANPSYNVFKNIPVKAGVTYIIEPKARMITNMVYPNCTSNSDCIEHLASADGYTSYTPTKDGYVYLSVYSSDILDSYAFYENGATNVFPFSKVQLSSNTVVANSDKLYSKKWAVCGDSFTYGKTTSKLTDGKYAGKQKTYPYFIGNRTGIDVLDFFESGGTLAYPADGTFTNSLTCPTQARGKYYQNIPVDVDYITIYLGINDSHHEKGTSGTDGEDVTGVIPLGTITDSDTSTYCGAWNVVLSWLIENRPYAHIGIIVANGCDRAEYRTAQIEIARKYGIPFIDMNGDDRTPVMIRSMNPDISNEVKTIINKKQAVDYDGTITGKMDWHPNDEAHEYESYFIENFLRSI